jgi:peroxiredoxin
MMNKFLLVLLLPVLSFAQTTEREFKLKGELKLSRPVEWVYLRYGSGDRSVNDSLQPQEGAFRFEGKISEPTAATLIVKYAKQPAEEKAPREFVQVFLEPSKLELIARDSLKNTVVTGSPGQADFASMGEQGKTFTQKMDGLYEAYEKEEKQGNQEAKEKIEKEIDQLDAEMKEAVYAQFVKDHPNSTVALYALRQYAGWDINPLKLEPLFQSLPSSTQRWPSALALKKQIDIARRTAIGNNALDFTQNDTLGNPVSLSSFRGKYLLIDFWASWCGPCRRENPNIVRTFNKYKDKNFTILGVSLDRSNGKERWLKAIHDDGLTWNHVSDLKWWDNEVAKKYGIRAIPQNLLLDPGGRIIAKNLNGAELDRKLGEVLSN